MANIPVNVSDEVLAKEAYEKVKPELAKFDDDDLIQVNVDVSGALQTMLGVLPELRAIRDQIAKELPFFDLASFDRLEERALALSFAQTAYVVATETPSELQPLTEQGVELRETLLRDAQALARRSLIDGAQLANLKGVNGYKNIAQDLQSLSMILEDAWPNIQGKCATTLEELKTASQISTRLSRVVGVREQGPAQVAAATDARQRTFTLALRTYDDARRAVTYLRPGEGEADAIIPSIYPGRPRRRADAERPGNPSATSSGTDAVASGTTSDPSPAQTPPGVTPVAASAATAQNGGAASKGPFLQD